MGIRRIANSLLKALVCCGAPLGFVTAVAFLCAGCTHVPKEALKTKLIERVDAVSGYRMKYYVLDEQTPEEVNHGFFQVFYENGNPYLEQQFAQGKQEGLCRIYATDGRLMLSGEFRNDHPWSGSFIVGHRVERYLNGKFVGTIREPMRKLPIPKREEVESSFEDSMAKAEKGDANAQYQVGLHYEMGSGVGKSLKEAAKWYERGARQGSIKAQFKWSLRLQTGQGTAKDPIEAYAWLFLATERGLESGGRHLAISQSHLSVEQLDAARKRGRQLLEQFGAPSVPSTK